MLIIGIDPGKTTGLVGVIPADSTVDIVFHAHVSSLAATRWLALTLQNEVGVHVVAERFTISQRTVSGTRAGAAEAMYTLGAVRHLCSVADVPFTLQAPSSAKSAVADPYLSRLGLLREVDGPHERDALRHALLYARTKNLWKGTTA